jgi:hypothetical protein
LQIVHTQKWHNKVCSNGIMKSRSIMWGRKWKITLLLMHHHH